MVRIEVQLTVEEGARVWAATEVDPGVRRLTTAAVRTLPGDAMN